MWYAEIPTRGFFFLTIGLNHILKKNVQLQNVNLPDSVNLLKAI